MDNNNQKWKIKILAEIVQNDCNFEYTTSDDMVIFPQKQNTIDLLLL